MESTWYEYDPYDKKYIELKSGREIIGKYDQEPNSL